MKNHIKKPLLKDVYKSQRTIEEATEKSKLKLNPSLDDIHNIRKSSEKKKPFFELGYYLATTQGQQPLSIVEIKKMFGGNEKYYREFLPFFCDVIKPKWVGRPPKLNKKAGKPFHASYNAPPIVANNPKTLYQPSQEKIDAFQKEIIAMLCDYLEITETQFYRRCRLFEKKYKDELIRVFFNSSTSRPSL